MTLWEMTPIGMFQLAWPYAKAAFQVAASLAGLAAALGSMLWAFVDTQGGLAGLAAHIDLITASVQGLPSSTILNYVNRVFPLTELLGLLAAYYAFIVLCIAVRWIRSFIPTMGG